MREGSLQAPTRYPIDWTNPDYGDASKLDDEMRRVSDICHSCRRCFNLCDSFPRLFQLIDESETGEVDAVASKDFAPVVEACTLCDMCFMTKCPYVPPHEFNVDFPQLMLRYRAVQRQEGHSNFVADQLAQIDRNGRWLQRIAPLVNWATKISNRFMRLLIEKLTGIHRHIVLPVYAKKTLAAQSLLPINLNAPRTSQKVVLFASCYDNYHTPEAGIAAQAVLAHNGVETEVIYPGCCGMPRLEQGDISAVVTAAQRISRELISWIDKGYAIVSLVPSCTFMIKTQWALLCPDDLVIKSLAQHTYDISDYIIHLKNTVGLTSGLKPVAGGITLHMACHARAQNQGQKAAEMLRCIPDTPVNVIERCSGHGGTFAALHFETALKVGTPTARQIQKYETSIVSSECPLAGKHLMQTIEHLDATQVGKFQTARPIEILAKSYGLISE